MQIAVRKAVAVRVLISKYTDKMNAVHNAKSGLRIAYVLDPRFRGGTSSAVAAELNVVSRLGSVHVYGLETKMFSGRYIAPQLSDAVNKLNLPFTWASTEIAADIVIFHNPSCLKFQDRLGVRIIARHLIVITHENFLRPGGAEAFDVGKCLNQIAECSVTLRRSLAPISAWNRTTVEGWEQENVSRVGWPHLAEDWFNICSFDKVAPTSTPRDRRGRHSRPGPEKFPQPAVMEMCFPSSAERNIILGADRFIGKENIPVHWSLYPFGGLTVPEFFDKFDFFVYFTAPTWRESFGRVVAEAVAAGKIVITDAETAATFQGGAIGARPEEVDDIISQYIAAPERYQADVISAQAILTQFSAEAFETRLKRILDQLPGASR